MGGDQLIMTMIDDVQYQAEMYEKNVITCHESAMNKSQNTDRRRCTSRGSNPHLALSRSKLMVSFGLRPTYKYTRTQAKLLYEQPLVDKCKLDQISNSLFEQADDIHGLETTTSPC